MHRRLLLAVVALLVAFWPRLAAAQFVNVWAWAEPTPFAQNDEIVVNVDASWNTEVMGGECGSEMDGGCYAVAHEVSVWGSDGFSDGDWQDDGPWGWGYDFWQFWDYYGPVLMVPIYYSIDVTVYYCDAWYWYCFDVSGDSYASVEPEELEITSDNGSTVWWFNGEDPDSTNFPTSITLTSSGGHQTQWSVSTNSEFGEAVELGGTSGESIAITANDVGSGGNLDMSVVAQVGYRQATFRLTARLPGRFEPDNSFPGGTNVETTCPLVLQQTPVLVQGWADKIWYVAKDQLNTAMKSVPYNEYWTTSGAPDHVPTSSYQRDWTGSFNWGFASPTGAITQATDGRLWDLIQVAGSTTTMPSVNPPSCGNGTAVDRWEQQWFVGSQTAGNGVRVQRNTLRRYFGRGAHEGVQSPPGGG